MIKYIELNQLSSINNVYLVKIVFFVNHKLNYQLVQYECGRKYTCDTGNLYLKYKMHFFDPAHEMPILTFCALFHHVRGWENEFCKCGVKGHHIKKIYINKLFSCN